MTRLLIFVVVMGISCCSIAVPPPGEKGWKGLEFVCTVPTTGRQIYPTFYVSETEHGEWEDVDDKTGLPKIRHYSHPTALQKNSYGPAGEVIKLRDLDRSTGRLVVHNLMTGARPFYDCELRGKNIF